MKKIDILEWDITYHELVEWVSRNDVVLIPVNGYGAGASTVYIFEKDIEYMAFALAFHKEQNNS